MGGCPHHDIQRIASGEEAISKSFTESIYSRFSESFWQLAEQISLLLNCDVWQYQFLYLHWLATYAVHNTVSAVVWVRLSPPLCEIAFSFLVRFSFIILLLYANKCW
ncbi:uncharacterized protein LOC127566370 isoform X2 [Drosophila albomicans]|uniref:Uncharacterized protein LOC127566370 isoform X2 n=1 Tax=Drosophila albomicans TaxID=7291 RepID=A0A9C6W9F4_DROAB|nr:uncharacterized protein LOC127566370 isoform X2 [Drosophila albomicans]